MAERGFFRMRVEIGSRANGRSAPLHAAYLGRTCGEDPRTGRTVDFSHRADELTHCELLLPEGAPDWARDPHELWRRHERACQRWDSQVYREIQVALPHQLPHEARVAAVGRFAQEELVRHGMAVEFFVHRPHGPDADPRNHEAHLLVTKRELRADGFGPVRRDWDAPEWSHWRPVNSLAEGYRQAWEDIVNEALEAHDLDVRVSRDSNALQGLPAPRGWLPKAAYLAEKAAQRTGVAWPATEAAAVAAAKVAERHAADVQFILEALAEDNLADHLPTPTLTEIPAHEPEQHASRPLGAAAEPLGSADQPAASGAVAAEPAELPYDAAGPGHRGGGGGRSGDAGRGHVAGAFRSSRNRRTGRDRAPPGGFGERAARDNAGVAEGGDADWPAPLGGGTPPPGVGVPEAAALSRSLAGLRLGRALGGLAEALLHGLERARAEGKAERHAPDAADDDLSHESVAAVGPIRPSANDIAPVKPIVPPARPREAAEQLRPSTTRAQATIQPEVAPPETPRASTLKRLGAWLARLGAAAVRPFMTAPAVVPPSLSPKHPGAQVRGHILVKPLAPTPAVQKAVVTTSPRLAEPAPAVPPRDMLLNGEEVPAAEYLRRLRNMRAAMEARGRGHLAAPLDSAIEAAERLPPDEQVRAHNPFRRVPGTSPVIAAKGRQAGGREPPRSPAAR